MTLAQAIEIIAAFEREQVRYVLIGSMAMALQGIVRATEDIDFFVDPESSNVDRIKRALRSVFDDDSIDQIESNDLAGEYAVVRYGPAEQDLTIDLVGKLGDAFAFEDIEHEVIDHSGVSIRVATPRMLHRMKRDTVRPQDRVDADRLRQAFNLDEEA